jgi:GH24 family phage-related lysozyme (muramidase)
MICKTVKAGFECAFMTKNGCSFANGICATVDDKCEGCGKIITYESANYCKIYTDPASKWLIGRCPTATHVKLEIKETQKINPLKASKRASKKA